MTDYCLFIKCFETLFHHSYGYIITSHHLFAFQAKQHCFDDLTQGPIFPSLLDAGLLFILRWALDDSIDLVIVAALNCLRAVLVNPADQVIFMRLL